MINHEPNLADLQTSALQGNEQHLREQLCYIGELMHRLGLIDGASGNISARLEDEGGEMRILATPSGLAKGFMQPGQLIVVNIDGERVDEPTAYNAHLRPTSELLMHLECYRQRPDVHGVVHAHPPTSVALTIAGYNFQQCLIPEIVIMMGMIPVAPYSTPASAENRDAIYNLISQHDAILLAHHGSLTVGATVWDAYLRLESLEHTAKMLYMVEMLGGAKSTIEPEQVRKLLKLRGQLGLMRPGDEERFAPFV